MRNVLLSQQTMLRDSRKKLRNAPGWSEGESFLERATSALGEMLLARGQLMSTPLELICLLLHGASVSLRLDLLRTITLGTKAHISDPKRPELMLPLRLMCSSASRGGTGGWGQLGFGSGGVLRAGPACTLAAPRLQSLLTSHFLAVQTVAT